MPRATGLGSSDDLGVPLGCSSVPLSLGDVLNACFSGVMSHQTQDVPKPLVREIHGLHITPKLPFPGMN